MLIPCCPLPEKSQKECGLIELGQGKGQGQLFKMSVEVFGLEIFIKEER